MLLNMNEGAAHYMAAKRWTIREWMESVRIMTERVSEMEKQKAKRNNSKK